MILVDCFWDCQSTRLRPALDCHLLQVPRPSMLHDCSLVEIHAATSLEMASVLQ